MKIIETLNNLPNEYIAGPHIRYFFKAVSIAFAITLGIMAFFITMIWLIAA